MKNIAIFASGSGTNAQKIIEHFIKNPIISVKRIYCNNKDAYVIIRGKNFRIPTLLFGKNGFYHSNVVKDKLMDEKIDLIVLAGFLWLVPDNILKAFPDKIINIHPALLPKYGGKGMYGSYVHEAVINNGEKESGISIHYVNEKYDDGRIIFQAKCKIDKNESPGTLASKIHLLEHKYYPQIIEKILSV